MNLFNRDKKSDIKTIYKVEGMDCASCAALIESDLEDAGIVAQCSYPKQTLEIKGEGFDEKKVKEIVANTGYKLLS